jgi:hypothetical protein
MSSSAIATKREVNSSSMKARLSDEAGRRFSKLATAKKSIRPPPERFPTGVQKSYFMLSDAERTWATQNSLTKSRECQPCVKALAKSLQLVGECLRSSCQTPGILDKER